ncbi:NUDIX hydrolase [Paenibacillus oceani]|uniref:NUDIX hydrolase n=1 Tax=Paenibacillus oceani TaxID=2772510 RepID=A0A927C8A0_9BACL|nr:NUDIX hydrolase [Paenibacillus oceani]MBD2861862.1 NUDIX hydrolase [Paenibacillus oceani]
MGYVEELRSAVGHRPLILVGAVTLVLDDQDRLLLEQRRHPYGRWALPGGLMELGESAEQTAIREVREETGLTIGDLQLVDVFSGPEQFITAPNGDQFYAVTVAYFTRNVSGQLQIDYAESLDFQYFEWADLPDDIVKSHRKIIDRYLSQQDRRMEHR